ncbi:MAG: hypothetical protein ACI8XZ_002210, partial [Gammaproteobacteria bacterium]
MILNREVSSDSLADERELRVDEERRGCSAF